MRFRTGRQAGKALPESKVGCDNVYDADKRYQHRALKKEDASTRWIVQHFALLRCQIRALGSN